MHDAICIVSWVFVMHGVMDLLGVTSQVLAPLMVAISLWMSWGVFRLYEAGWRSARGAGQPWFNWVPKDGFAMLIWPFVYRWIATRSEREISHD